MKRLAVLTRDYTMYRAASLALYLLMSFVFASPISIATAQQQSLRDRITGTWKVVSWETLRPNGQIVNIWMGLHPTGLLIYLPNGLMSVQVMADPRPTFTKNPATMPPPYDEFRNAFYSYYAYWGTYTISDAGDSVVHNVLGSERPAEVGRKYQRSASIEGTKLILTTPPYKAGLGLPYDLLERMQIPPDEELVNRLTFERIE